jgi:hypothetical protein
MKNARYLGNNGKAIITVLDLLKNKINNTTLRLLIEQKEEMFFLLIG